MLLGALVIALLALAAAASADQLGTVVFPHPAHQRAISILRPLRRQQPDHPGAAHYLIHAADRPGLAPLGLEAARTYATIAPDSSHALHMPSHIFVRLGLWAETIALNLRAAASGAHAAMDHRGDYTYQIHAMDFLRYAYLQRGLESKAGALQDEPSDVPAASDKENWRIARPSPAAP